MLQHTQSAPLEVLSSFESNGQHPNHVLLVFGYVIFDNTVDSLSMEDSVDEFAQDSWLSLDDLNTGAGIKGIVKSSSLEELSHGDAFPNFYRAADEFSADDLEEDFLHLFYDEHAVVDIKDVLDASSSQESWHDDAFDALRTPDSKMEHPLSFLILVVSMFLLHPMLPTSVL